tara:strand:+ start:4930 stop:5469 length:540 start_codon:yes stop_codon:yes gene_type:complete
MTDTAYDLTPKAIRPAADLKSPPGKRVIPIVKWNDFHDWPSVKTFRYMIRTNHLNVSSVVVRRGKRILVSEERFATWVEFNAPKILQLALANGWVDVRRDGPGFPGLSGPRREGREKSVCRDEFSRKEISRLDSWFDQQRMLQSIYTRNLGALFADALDDFAARFRSKLEQFVRNTSDP